MKFNCYFNDTLPKCPMQCERCKKFEAPIIEGTKFDNSKLRMDLLPVIPLQRIADILTFGAKKYGDRNWEAGIEWNRVYGALMRHLTAWWSGESLDKETGLSHLAHAGCNILFLLEYERTHKELDNRPK